MTYLLDVNALIALGYRHHVFHNRVAGWAERKSLATCSLVELGFVRVLAQLPEAEIPVKTALKLLAVMKQERGIIQIPESQSALSLPRWVHSPKQIADGHLVALAQANELTLATCDEALPGAFVIR